MLRLATYPDCAKRDRCVDHQEVIGDESLVGQALKSRCKVDTTATQMELARALL